MNFKVYFCVLSSVFLCFLRDFGLAKRNTRRGGVDLGQKNFKNIKKTFKKSVDEPNLIVVYYRCNRSKGFAKTIFEYCKSTLTTAYL